MGLKKLSQTKIKKILEQQMFIEQIILDPNDQSSLFRRLADLYSFLIRDIWQTCPKFSVVLIIGFV